MSLLWSAQAVFTSVVVVILLGATGLPSARADDTQVAAPTEDSSDLFRKGLGEYDARHYTSAIEIFQRVHRQTGAPALLFNIAQAWRLAGECQKAVATYEAFVAADPTSPDVARARGWLEKLRTCQPRLAAVPAPPSPAASKLLPAWSPPRPSVSVALVAAPSPVVVPPHDRPLLVGLLGGASVALAGAGGYAAWRAKDLGHQVSGSYANGGTWSPQGAALESEGKRTQVEATTFVSAAVLTATAAYVFHRLSARSRPKP